MPLRAAKPWETSPITERPGPLRPSLVHGPYVVERLLGRGGMAVVHVVRRSPDTGERFAMKRILPELADSRPFSRMFCNEAHLGRWLDHPNIVRVVDFGIQDGELALVTEYVDGIPCGRLLGATAKNGHGFPLDAALFIACELLLGLAYTHDAVGPSGMELDIVHGDVSPGNVLLGAMGEVKLADFGVARTGDPESDVDAGTLRGKLGYMSPEQLQGERVDRRSDLFSLGVVLYEMLTGRTFFRAVDDVELAAKMRDVPLSPLTEPDARRLPLELRLILATALARDPGDRFSDAAEFHTALRLFAQRSGIAVDRRPLVRLLRSMDVWPLRSGTYPAMSSSGSDGDTDRPVRGRR